MPKYKKSKSTSNKFPNKETINAIKEGEQMVKGGAKGYRNIESLKKALNI